MRVKRVCVSMYPEDIVILEQKVHALKALGHDMDKSKLIRLAIGQLNTEGANVVKSSDNDGV